MKKSIFTIFIVCAVASASAQSYVDLARFADNEILGTPRYMSMAGAFGALGGDASSIIDNPAGLGIYRSAEAAVTLNLLANQPISTTKSSIAIENDIRFRVNQASFVWAIVDREKESGWVASNLSFCYNRLRNYDRVVTVRNRNTAESLTNFVAGMASEARLLEDDLKAENNPFDNVDVGFLPELAYQGYLIDPDATPGQWKSLLKNGETLESAYKARERGEINEFSFAYGANISNVFYWGVSVGIHSLNFSSSSVTEEKFGEGGGFLLQNTVRTSGVGYNVKFGVIARVTDFLRLGASVHSPTYYSLADYSSATLDYDTQEKGEIYSPSTSSYYRFQTPLRFQASAAFIIKKSAIISFDYQLSHNQGMKIGDRKGSALTSATDAFSDVQSDIANWAKMGHLFKFGAEYRVIDGFGLRVGAAYRLPTIKSEAEKLVNLNTTRTDMEAFRDGGYLYASAGLGYRTKGGFGIDAAYAYSQHMQEFTPFVGSENIAKIASHAHNVTLAISWKF